MVIMVDMRCFSRCVVIALKQYDSQGNVEDLCRSIIHPHLTCRMVLTQSLLGTTTRT